MRKRWERMRWLLRFTFNCLRARSKLLKLLYDLAGAIRGPDFSGYYTKVVFAHRLRDFLRFGGGSWRPRLELNQEDLAYALSELTNVRYHNAEHYLIHIASGLEALLELAPLTESEQQEVGRLSNLAYLFKGVCRGYKHTDVSYSADDPLPPEIEQWWKEYPWKSNSDR